jgi:hypothetical protein
MCDERKNYKYGAGIYGVGAGLTWPRTCLVVYRSVVIMGSQASSASLTAQIVNARRQWKADENEVCEDPDGVNQPETSHGQHKAYDARDRGAATPDGEEA